MLPGDSIEAILPSLKILKDERIEHFYDPNQRSGKEIAMSVGWDGRVAWDIYLFYPPNIDWPDIPPRPVSWMHQISDEWAKNERYHTGDQLIRELDLALKKLIEK
jgi:hypothetical protein